MSTSTPLDELGDFTLEETVLSVKELLNIIKSENKEVPISTYEKLLSIVQELDFEISTSTKEKLSTGDKIALLSIIIQILLQLLSPSERNEINPSYNVYNTINTQIQSSSNNLSQSDISTICDKLIKAIDNQQN